jgi:hypothetical protein
MPIETKSFADFYLGAEPIGPISASAPGFAAVSKSGLSHRQSPIVALSRDQQSNQAVVRKAPLLNTVSPCCARPALHRGRDLRRSYARSHGCPVVIIVIIVIIIIIIIVVVVVVVVVIGAERYSLRAACPPAAGRSALSASFTAVRPAAQSLVNDR